MRPTNPCRPLLAAAAMLAATPALAVTSDKFEYDAAQVGYYAISAAAMAPASHEVEYNLFPFPPILSLGLAGGCLSTGVNLPQGASLVSLQTWTRSDEQSDIQVSLVRQIHGSLTFDYLVNEPVVDDSDVLATNTYTVPGPLRVVKNGTYAYSFHICVNGQGTAFHSARVRYTYRNAGD